MGNYVITVVAVIGVCGVLIEKFQLKKYLDKVSSCTQCIRKNIQHEEL